LFVVRLLVGPLMKCSALVLNDASAQIGVGDLHNQSCVRVINDEVILTRGEQTFVRLSLRDRLNRAHRAGFGHFEQPGDLVS